jgi:hypothetical protein
MYNQKYLLNPRFRFRKEKFGYVIGNPYCILGTTTAGYKLLNMLTKKTPEQIAKGLSSKYDATQNQIAEKISKISKFMINKKFLIPVESQR